MGSGHVLSPLAAERHATEPTTLLVIRHPVLSGEPMLTEYMRRKVIASRNYSLSR
jgi:hypothetical protein